MTSTVKFLRPDLDYSFNQQGAFGGQTFYEPYEIMAGETLRV